MVGKVGGVANCSAFGPVLRHFDRMSRYVFEECRLPESRSCRSRDDVASLDRCTTNDDRLYEASQEGAALHSRQEEGATSSWRA